jgi:hypothetical protein
MIPFLEGAPVKLLHPSSDWQSGQLSLHLGFEFVPQDASQESPLTDSGQAEAEFLEGTIAPSVSIKPSVIEPATLVQLTTTNLFQQHKQDTVQQYLGRAIARLRQTPVSSEAEQLTAIVAEAFALVELFDRLERDANLTQPQFLLDELSPKLLWHLSRSSYEVTQLLGGVEAQVLQPLSGWTHGILRLLVTLILESDDTEASLDLATGCPLNRDTILLHPDAIAQSSTLQPCQQPIEIATLFNALLQCLHTSMPELHQWSEGIPIQWLTAQQDWHPGTLRLHFNLELIPSTYRHLEWVE